ncbi:NUDIX hydrolase [Ruania alba]|uniref:NUDIX domain-containing protein n=1 Tax=Ruania alba TaxID=648782 RepID=A0A1H5CLG4_9MICO|nr:NUDIX domain-containing protein [Ruania alba]SED67532.1 NUDIX domain-containing protein [Ruania alba]
MDFDTRFAAYGVIIDPSTEQILLALWNESDRPRWTMPGGGADLAEIAEQTMVREVWEETGYRVEAVRLLGIDTHHIPAERRLHGTRPMKAVRAVYEAAIIGGDLRHEENGSTDEARWIPLAEVGSLDRVELVDCHRPLARRGRELTVPA